MFTSICNSFIYDKWLFRRSHRCSWTTDYGVKCYTPIAQFFGHDTRHRLFVNRFAILNSPTGTPPSKMVARISCKKIKIINYYLPILIVTLTRVLIGSKKTPKTRIFIRNFLIFDRGKRTNFCKEHLCCRHNLNSCNCSECRSKKKRQKSILHFFLISLFLYFLIIS